MGQMTDQITVPGDQKIECGFVHGHRAAGSGKEETFGPLPLPIPSVFTGQGPSGISRRLRRAMFRYQPGGHLRAHLGRDGAGVLAP